MHTSFNSKCIHYLFQKKSCSPYCRLDLYGDKQSQFMLLLMSGKRLCVCVNVYECVVNKPHLI